MTKQQGCRNGNPALNNIETSDGMNGFIGNQYDLKVNSSTETSGGWSALAYVLDTDKGRFFVKAYDKHRPSVQVWINRMKLYMPTVLWLSENTPLRDRMVVPVLTKDGCYKAETDDSVYLLFPFIDGVTPGQTRLNSLQITQLAESLALLHSHGADIPADTDRILETYSLPFLDDTFSVINSRNIPYVLHEILQTYTETILMSIDVLKSLSLKMQLQNPQKVLCHTDLHGWNMMSTDGGLILVDWEGLILAPVEADLFSFSSGFFFDYAADEFYEAYKKACPEFTINELSMRYYRLRRRLEDISAFLLSLSGDDRTSEETEMSLMLLKKECAALDNVAGIADI